MMSEGEIVAVHEAAHAVFAAFGEWTRLGGPVVIKGPGYGDVVMATDTKAIRRAIEADPRFDRDLPRIHLIRALLAGPIAERLLAESGRAELSERDLLSTSEDDYAIVAEQIGQLRSPRPGLLARLEREVRQRLEQPRSGPRSSGSRRSCSIAAGSIRTRPRRFSKASGGSYRSTSLRRRNESGGGRRSSLSCAARTAAEPCAGRARQRRIEPIRPEFGLASRPGPNRVPGGGKLMHAPLATRPVQSSAQRREPRGVSSAHSRQALLNSAPRVMQLKAQSELLNGRFASRRAPQPAILPDQSSDAPIQLMLNGMGFRDEIEEIAPTSLWDIFYGMQVYRDNPEFSTIADLLDSYSELEDTDEDDEDEATRQEMTRLLYEIEHEAYAWYSEHPAAEDAANEETGQSKNEYHDIIIALLRDVEEERIGLAKRIVSNEDDIWVPGIDDMEEGEQRRTQGLWKGLLGNRGRLKVKASASEDEKAKIYANYLQLVSGAQGRQLLTRAMAGNRANQSHVITIDPSIGGEPEAAPINSPASHRRFPANHPRFAESVDETQQITLTERELGETVAGPGSGSVVNFRDSPQVGKLYALGPHNIDDPVKPYELMPAFLVLGHELGHAVRQQHGESTVRFKSPFHDTREGHTWHNREEQAVITGTENKLRREHDLGARKYHRAVALGRG